MNKYDEYAKYDYIEKENGLMYDFSPFKFAWYITEQMNFSDVIALYKEWNLEDEMQLLDNKDLRTCSSDFYIGSNPNYQKMPYTWLMPFEVIVDIMKSDIPKMPTSEHTYTEVVNKDGQEVSSTTYRNRLFQFVCWSIDGLTVEEKERLKAEISRIINTTKNFTKVMTFQENNLNFNVKYHGEETLEEAPSSIKVTLPFEASPYGTELFSRIITGDNTIENDGDVDIGFIVTIESGCVTPNFLIGSTEFLWNDTVPNDKDLIIDCQDKSCYLLATDGTRTSVITKLTRGYRFMNIPAHTEIELQTLNSSTSSKISVEYTPQYLWR